MRAVRGTAANDAARDAARQLVGQGYAGLITAATFQPELTHLGVGFYANVGATTEVMEEHRGRLGLPPVFLPTQRVSWVELETGAELHVRCSWPATSCAHPAVLERLVTRGRCRGRLHPALVASYPIGESWPPAPDLRQAHRRTRRVRRWAAAAILLAGVIDLLDAVTPPLRGRLHLVLEFLPLRASVAAGALIAMAGLALIALGRGILRGQRRAWRVAVVPAVGHHRPPPGRRRRLRGVADRAPGARSSSLANRRDFQPAVGLVLAAVGPGRPRVGGLGITLVTTASSSSFIHIRHHHPPPFVDRLGGR